MIKADVDVEGNAAGVPIRPAGTCAHLEQNLWSCHIRALVKMMR